MSYREKLLDSRSINGCGNVIFHVGSNKLWITVPKELILCESTRYDIWRPTGRVTCGMVVRFRESSISLQTTVNRLRCLIIWVCVL